MRSSSGTPLSPCTLDEFHHSGASSHLLNAQVGVNGGIARCAGKVLVLPVGDVDVRLGVTVLLGQPKVNNVHLQVVGAFCSDRCW